jgi:L-aspartate oxidase
MWEHAGLERSAAGLLAASDRLDGWRAPEAVDRRTAEDRNLLDLARLTVAAALARTRSVGAHFRTDDPQSAATTRPPVASAATAPARQPALEEAA